MDDNETRWLIAILLPAALVCHGLTHAFTRAFAVQAVAAMLWTFVIIVFGGAFGWRDTPGIGTLVSLAVMAQFWRMTTWLSDRILPNDPHMYEWMNCDVRTSILIFIIVVIIASCACTLIHLVYN